MIINTRGERVDGGGGGVALQGSGTSVQSSGTVQFANSNGVTFGLSGSQMTASVAGGPGGSGFVAQGSGTYTQQTGTIQWANSNGVSFGLTAGQMTATVKTDYLTTAAQVSHSHGNPNLQLTNLSGSTSSSSNGFSLALSVKDALGTASGGSNVTWTYNTGGITFDGRGYGGTGLSTTNAPATLNSAGLALNLTGHAGTGTTTASTAGSDLALTLNSNGISMGVPKWLTTAAAGGGFAAKGSGVYSQNTGTIEWANSNGITFGLSTNQMTASYNSTSAISAATSASNVTWTVNSAGIALDARGYAGTATGGNNASLTVNSGGITVSVAPPGGGAAATLAMFTPPWGWDGKITNSSLGQNTIYVQPFDLPYYMSASRINFYISINGSLSAGNSTGTCYQRLSYAIYTRDGAGTGSVSLNRLTSYGLTFLSHSMNSNTQYRATHYNGLSNATSHSTAQTGISSSNASTYLASLLNGPRVLALPLGITMTPGRYWLALAVSTISGNAMGNGLSVMFTQAGPHPEVRVFGVSTQSSNNSVFRQLQGWGSYSATSGAFPATIAFTTDNIRAAVSQTLIHFDLCGCYTSTNVV